MKSSFTSYDKISNESRDGTGNKKRGNQEINKDLLACGILSSVLYVMMNIVGPMLYGNYRPVSQTVSELSAIGAPTRALWVALAALYTVLFLAFAWGVQQAGKTNRRLRITGNLLLVYGIISLAWPFAPMHQREVLAAGGETISDSLHIALAMITVPLMLLAIGFGAGAFGKRFCIYSISSLVVLCFFGVLTGIDGPKISQNLPTPWIGIWERILIAVFLLWISVLANLLLRQEPANKFK
ncbi:MAG: DUF998 domain-containing protein [Flavisolibacter sp.]